MVIFEVSGVIEVGKAIFLREPFVSIYGQTAPGDGIVLRGSLDSTDTPLIIATHDVLIQHIRFRAGSSTGITCCRDSLSIGSSNSQVYNIVMDHLSISWGVDEMMHTWYDPHDITISRSIISESLHDNGSNDEGPAGRGLLIGSEGAHSVSVHHNFFAHSYQRNPLIKISGISDVVNNLVYHWVSRGGGVTSDFAIAKSNWVKNKYIAVTGFADSHQDSSINWGGIILSKSNYGMEVYFEDNIGHYRPTNDLPQWQVAQTGYKKPYNPDLGYHTDKRHPAPPITEIPVEQLEEQLPLDVGATLPRQDVVDLRLFEELRNRSGFMPNCVSQNDRPGDSRCDVNVGGWPSYSQEKSATDSDDDGIPDEWEEQNGLDPDKHDSLLDRNNDGYLNIEEWIASIR